MNDHFVDIEINLNLAWSIVFLILFIVSLLQYYNVNWDLLVGSPERQKFRKLTLFVSFACCIISILQYLQLKNNISNKYNIDRITLALWSIPVCLVLYCGIYFCEVKIKGHTGQLCQDVSPSTFQLILTQFKLTKLYVNPLNRICLFFVIFGLVLSSLLKLLALISITIISMAVYDYCLYIWIQYMKRLLKVIIDDIVTVIKLSPDKKELYTKRFKLLKIDIRRARIVMLWWFCICISNLMLASVLLILNGFNSQPPILKKSINRKLYDNVILILIYSGSSICFFIEIICLLYVDWLDIKIVNSIKTCNKNKGINMSQEKSSLGEVWPLPAPMTSFNDGKNIDLFKIDVILSVDREISDKSRNENEKSKTNKNINLTNPKSRKKSNYKNKSFNFNNTTHVTTLKEVSDEKTTNDT